MYLHRLTILTERSMLLGWGAGACLGAGVGACLGAGVGAGAEPGFPASPCRNN